MAEFRIHGYWLDLREAMERVDPDIMSKPEAERKRLWDFATKLLDEYMPNKFRCYGCKEILPQNAAFRCADCKMAYCEQCIRPHFEGKC